MPGDFSAVVSPLFAFLDETPDRVPFSDWGSTAELSSWRGRAHLMDT